MEEEVGLEEGHNIFIYTGMSDEQGKFVLT
jgi:hypothetical protein